MTSQQEVDESGKYRVESRTCEFLSIQFGGTIPVTWELILGKIDGPHARCRNDIRGRQRRVLQVRARVGERRILADELRRLRVRVNNKLWWFQSKTVSFISLDELSPCLRLNQNGKCAAQK